jgi:hypothetical protein
MPNTSRLFLCILVLGSAGLAGCSATNGPPVQAQSSAYTIRSAYGLGPTVQPRVPGTILGFDIDQHGDDGVFANYQQPTPSEETYSIETFDEDTGKITGVVKQGKNESYGVDGILAGDIGFLTRNHAYRLMNPVTGGKFTGSWAAPMTFYLSQIAENQSTATALMFGYNGSIPSAPTTLVTADIVKGTSKVIALDQNLFNTGTVPVVAQDPATNQGVVAGDNGGRMSHPTIGIVNLKSGKTTTFQGLGYGDVNGIGVDSKTGIACTTTEIDAGVEFYDLKKRTGIEVQLPNSEGSEEHSGSGVAVDSLHGVCIVAQPVSGDGTQASAIWVVDEKGNFLGEITGFDFWFGVGPAINPSKRIGYVENPRPLYATLTGFSY